MKFLLSSLVTLVLVGLFNFAPLHAQESKPADKPAVEEQKTDTTKTESADKPVVEPEKAVDAEKDKDKSVEPAVSPPQPGNEPVPKKIDISGENPFDSDKYKTIDVDLKYKANPAADSIFIFFNYLTMAAMVVMVVSVAIWVFKNRDKLADSGTSASVSPKAASKKEEKSEEETEEKSEDKAEEKSEDKAEEKSEDKAEEKSEDKAEEKSEDKAEEKSEDKAEEKSEDKAEEKSEDKAEEKSEDKAEEKSEDKAEEKSTRKKSSKSRGKSGKSKKSDA